MFQQSVFLRAAGAAVAASVVFTGVSGTCFADLYTFQQGNAVYSGGPTYTGTQDTTIIEDAVTEQHGSDPTFTVDPSHISNNGKDLVGLLRFDNVFGSNPGQIPVGSTITSATLTLNEESGSGQQVVLGYRMLQTWSSSTTWSTTPSGSGVHTNDTEAASTTSFTLPTGQHFVSEVDTADVQADVQAWATDPNSAFGWVLLPQESGTNGHTYSSSESLTLANRPMLSIDFEATAVPESSPMLFGLIACVAIAAIRGRSTLFNILKSCLSE